MLGSADPGWNYKTHARSKTLHLRMLQRPVQHAIVRTRLNVLLWLAEQIKLCPATVVVKEPEFGGRTWEYGECRDAACHGTSVVGEVGASRGRWERWGRRGWTSVKQLVKSIFLLVVLDHLYVRPE